MIVIYACGFLITSIHDFQYGFSEMNPFRPRILAAGTWFFLFLAVPFTLVRQIAKSEALKRSDVKGVPRLVNLSWAYLASCNFIVLTADNIFRLDTYATSMPKFVAWKVSLWVAGIVTLLVLITKYADKFPKWVSTVLTAGLLLYFAGNAYNDFFNLGKFYSNAILLWLLGMGAVFAFELTLRSWKPTLGDWPQTLIFLLAAALIFATRYYPHILSAWGGGQQFQLPSLIPRTRLGSLLKMLAIFSSTRLKQDSTSWALITRSPASFRERMWEWSGSRH